MQTLTHTHTHLLEVHRNYQWLIFQWKFSTRSMSFIQRSRKIQSQFAGALTETVTVRRAWCSSLWAEETNVTAQGSWAQVRGGTQVETGAIHRLARSWNRSEEGFMVKQSNLMCWLVVSALWVTLWRLDLFPFFSCEWMYKFCEGVDCAVLLLSCSEEHFC